MKRMILILLCLAGTSQAVTLQDVFKKPCRGTLEVRTEAGNMKAGFCYDRSLMVIAAGYLIQMSHDSVWVYNPEGYTVLGKLTIPFYRLMTGFKADSMEVIGWTDFDSDVRLPSEIRLGKTSIRVVQAQHGVQDCPVMPKAELIDLWY